MVNFLGFWALFIGLLLSWGLVIYSPAHYFYWFILCLVFAVFLSYVSTRNDKQFKSYIIDCLSFVLLCTGIFFWLLWLDFGIIKYIIAALVWMAIVYFMRDSRSMGVLARKTKLGIFFAGTFFWATISFGLLTVLGWKIWHCLIIFIFSFAVLSFTGIQIIADNSKDKIKAWLLCLVLSAQLFSVIVWLPFTEVTLALILTIFILFIYDLLKYYLNPDLILRRIIKSKIIVYLIFLALALISTPWY